MIFAFSTSCAQVSVAIFSPEGEVLFSAQQEAHGRASGACIEMLETSGLSVGEGSLFLADLGPGSFTGTRVGVTLAKTFAWCNGVLCAGVSSFDLVSPDQTVVLPSKRGEWFVRTLGEDLVRTVELPSVPFLGFGPGIESPVYPNAERFVALLDRVERIAPEALVPLYLIEPSISIPKRKYGLVAAP